MRIIQSKQNASLKQLRLALKSPGRAPEGLVGLEGPNLLDEALRAGLRLRTVFVAQGAEALLDPLPLPRETEVLALPKALLDSALTTESPQSVAALVEPPQWQWRDLLTPSAGGPPLVLVLAALQDPGNLGAILRSAEAFGATGVVSLPGTVTPWNSKSLRASAGSVFRLPILAASENTCLQQLKNNGVRLFTTALQHAQPASEVDLASPAAIVIGNEGNGVPASLDAQCDAAVTIPCPGPVESLNAAVAASVLLYEASRQRACGTARPANGASRASSMHAQRGGKR